MIHQKNTDKFVSKEICHSGILQKAISKNPFKCPKIQGFPLYSYSKDGIGTPNPAI